jgi:hypothetical protein
VGRRLRLRYFHTTNGGICRKLIKHQKSMGRDVPSSWVGIIPVAVEKLAHFDFAENCFTSGSSTNDFPRSARQVPEKDRLNIRFGTTITLQHSQPGSYFPPSRLGCGRLRCHSLISFRNSLFLVSFVSVASCRSSSAIRPAAKSGRPDFLGFSNRIVRAPPSIVSHEDGFYDVTSQLSTASLWFA